MWLILIIPIGLLYFCFRLLFRNDKLKTAPVATVVETNIPEFTPIELYVQEDHSSNTKTLSEPEKESQEPQEPPRPPDEALPWYEPTLDLRDYKYPPMDLLETNNDLGPVPDESTLAAEKGRMVDLLKNYDIQLQSITVSAGPAVTMYEIVPAPGIRVSRIKHLEDEMSLGLAASGIRIIAPIPGKGTIGIEVPTAERRYPGIRSILASDNFQQSSFDLPIALGRLANNEDLIVDLAALPHLLIAGATGQGKSTGLHAILASLLYKKHPSLCKLVLIDPQKIEMNLYGPIEKHFLAKMPGCEAIVTDPNRFSKTLVTLCNEMDNRRNLLYAAGANNIKEYNEKFIERHLDPLKGHQYLPYIVVAVEDFSDLILSAGPDVEKPTIRLAEKGHRVGIHLILSISRLSSDVLSQELKAHFPSRIAYKVTSRDEARTILDEPGAERLLGKGDMLFKWNDIITRVQGAFIDTAEVKRIANFVGRQGGYPEAYKLPDSVDPQEMGIKDFDLSDRDHLFEEAAHLIVMNQLGSTSLIQRKMKLGYYRAGRLMDQLEAAGVVGPDKGSAPRDVLIKTVMELDLYLGN
jgi:S-DNA-T family DNA segregation ATPase FtsK/SpoIIIE